jgi:putative transposase
VDSSISVVAEGDADSTKVSEGRVRTTYDFIKANKDRFSVQGMCRVLGVAPSGYYSWLVQPISDRGKEDARLLRLIRASFTASQGIYGAPRVFLDLREAGETCSKHRVARLMRENRLRALHGYRVRRWSVGKPSVLIPNLLKRQFTVTRRNKAWVTDITYIRTWQGWLYLAVVLDLFSRKIVGWATAATIHQELVLDAVLMAVRRRRPRRCLIHSDQGTQYGGDAWRRFCRSNHLEPSMSRKGNCWDNAVAESFFGSLKKERIKKQIYKNRELAAHDVADYIRFYNRSRRHSHLSGMSPEQFEAAQKRR